MLDGRAEYAATGDEVRLESGEASLGVVVRGVDVEEADVDEEEERYEFVDEPLLFSLSSLVSLRISFVRGKGLAGGDRTREAGIWLSSSSGGTAMGSSSPSSVMRTARRGSGRGAKRILRRGWLAESLFATAVDGEET